MGRLQINKAVMIRFEKLVAEVLLAIAGPSITAMTSCAVHEAGLWCMRHSPNRNFA